MKKEKAAMMNRKIIAVLQGNFNAARGYRNGKQ